MLEVILTVSFSETEYQCARLVYVIEIKVLLPKQIQEDSQLVAALACVDPVRGDLPSPATQPSVMFRDTADPLTFQLHLLKTTVSCGVSAGKIHQIAKLYIAQAPSSIALCFDPMCLNIRPLQKPELVLKEWIEYSLGEMMGSSRILSLMQMDITAKGEILANDLYTLEPLYPRLRYLFNKSNAAYALSLLDKFPKSSTIIA